MDDPKADFANTNNKSIKEIWNSEEYISSRSEFGDEKEITKTINQVKNRKITKRKFFGEGNSAKKIETLLLSNKIWKISKQKSFVDLI